MRQRAQPLAYDAHDAGLDCAVRDAEVAQLLPALQHLTKLLQ